MSHRVFAVIWVLYFLVVVLAVGLTGALPMADAMQEPKACEDGWVRVWESGRYVCEPEEKTVAVFESECVAKVEVTKDSRIYMTLNYEGKPDLNDWHSEHLKLTLKENCQPHYEKLKVHQ